MAWNYAVSEQTTTRCVQQLSQMQQLKQKSN